jgi:hypothetical protein
VRFNPVVWARNGWAALYSKVKASLLGSVAAGTLGLSAVQLIETLNGEDTLTDTQTAVVVQVVTVLGGFLAARWKWERHPVGAMQPPATDQGMRMAGEPAPTPPGPGRLQP